MTDMKTVDSMTGWNHMQQEQSTQLSKNDSFVRFGQGYLESHMGGEGGSHICLLADSGSGLVSFGDPALLPR